MDPATALLILALAGGILAGQFAAGPPLRIVPGPVTTGMAAAVAAGLAVQLAVPGTLALLQRDAAAVAAGAWWRLATALFVQDGWIAGGLFNLAALLVAGAVAERLWRPAAWLLLYLGCGLAAGLVGLVWQPVGGGNSIAVCGLCGSLAARALLQPTPLPGRLAAAAGLAAGLGLAALHDIHGAALLLGAAGGGAIMLGWRRAVR